MWLTPFDADAVIHVNLSSGDVTAFLAWPSAMASIGSAAFVGGSFDGQSIWLVPYSANAVVRVATSDGSMAAFTDWPTGVSSVGSGAFVGGVFDGRWVWIVSSSSNVILGVDVLIGAMAEHPTSYSAVLFDAFGAPRPVKLATQANGVPI
jgi:hypothetical protein